MDDISVNLDQRPIGQSKITVVDRNFKLSKSTVVVRNSDKSKIMDVDQNFGKSKIKNSCRKTLSYGLRPYHQG